jgi:DNA-binding NtrC family response regulator
MNMKKRVLIVEDNPLIADAVAVLVEESLDCDTLMVPTVEEAMALLDAQVDLGILDVEVVDGLTYPLAARMMQHQIPFLFMSGSDPKKVPSDLASAPFLRKPVPPDALLTAAQRCL